MGELNYKKCRIISLVLMIFSGIILCSVIIYCDILSKVENYNYSTKEEYENVKAGLELLDKLPLQFNIVNKYFSSFSNLNIADKEKIALAYAVKNKIGVVTCDMIMNDTNVCISKAALENSNLFDVFKEKVKLYSDNISVYIDDYGMYTAKYIDSKDYYQIPINTFDYDTKLYSSFYKYRMKDDVYIFYLFQGYYKANCTFGEDLILYDFMDGREVFKDVCNDEGYFSKEPDFNEVNLQLYKYELKKDKSGNFYLYGYNPVNKYN